MSVESSKKIGGLLGPALLALLVSELPFVQPHLYDTQIPPVVYLSGVLAFVAGLAIVRAHNRWAWDWTVLVTLCGWSLLLLGLVRMFAAEAYRAASARTQPWSFVLLEGGLLVVAAIITFQSYRRDRA